MKKITENSETDQTSGQEKKRKVTTTINQDRYFINLKYSR